LFSKISVKVARTLESVLNPLDGLVVLAASLPPTTNINRRRLIALKDGERHRLDLNSCRRLEIGG
jgi:hypothetical protein